MPGTSQSFLGDMLAERVAKDRAVDDLMALQALAEGQAHAMLDYYGPAARRAAELDDRDQLEKVLRSLGRDMEAVERLRGHLLMTERGVRNPAELARVQHLKAELERLARKLRKMLQEVKSQKHTFFMLMRTVTPTSSKERQTPKRGKPGRPKKGPGAEDAEAPAKKPKKK
jgi:hypothetical protein